MALETSTIFEIRGLLYWKQSLGITAIFRCTWNLIRICPADFPYFSPIAITFQNSQFSQFPNFKFSSFPIVISVWLIFYVFASFSWLWRVLQLFCLINTRNPRKILDKYIELRFVDFKVSVPQEFGLIKTSPQLRILWKMGKNHVFSDTCWR